MIRCALPLTTRRDVSTLVGEHVDLREEHSGSTTTPFPMTGVMWS